MESDVWEPNKSLNMLLFVTSLLSIYFSPFSTNNNRATISTVFDHSIPSCLPKFQTTFLLLYSLSSVLEGLWVVFGEYELAYYGVSREQMVLILLFGFGVSLVVSSFLGIVSDLIGPQKVCLLFFMLHLSVAIWKRFVTNPSLWLAGVALSIASLIYSFSFETWLVVEHDKLGQKQDMLNDMFWLMIFFESVSFLGSQIPGNWFVGSNLETNGVSLSIVALVIAIISIILSLEDIKSHHGQYLWMIISNCLVHISYMTKGYGFYHGYKLVFTSPLWFSGFSGLLL